MKIKAITEKKLLNLHKHLNVQPCAPPILHSPDLPLRVVAGNCCAQLQNRLIKRRQCLLHFSRFDPLQIGACLVLLVGSNPTPLVAIVGEAAEVPARLGLKLINWLR